MTEIKPLSQVRREHILKVLGSTSGDQEQASRVLGINLEQLRRLIEHYGLTPREMGATGPAAPAPAAPVPGPPPPPRQKE